MHRLRFPAIVGACLLLSIAGFACGSDRPADDAPPVATAPKAVPTNIVRNADIRRTPSDTPQRTIMTWAQAVQFGDLPAVREAYTTRVREAVSAARMNAAAKVISSLLGRPEIVNVDVRGDRARIRVALVSYDGSGRRSEQPTTFLVRRESRRWRLDDAELLLDMATELRRVRG